MNLLHLFWIEGPTLVRLPSHTSIDFLNKFTGLLEVGVIIAKPLSARYPAVIFRDNNTLQNNLVRLVPRYTGD